jgi:hypothetical protein
MNSNIRQKANLLLYFFAIFGAAAMIYNVGLALFSGTTVHAQQDPFLSQRLNRIEQRFSTIETKIIQLESQSRFPSISPDLSRGQDTELQLLRSQINTLQLRVSEIECNLVRLDERTLSAAAKANRQTSGINDSDLCRQTPNVPLQLSARP